MPGNKPGMRLVSMILINLSDSSSTTPLEATEPIPDFSALSTRERVHFTVEFGGTRLGTLELPVFDGFLPGHVLADALAAEFAWSMLGIFFERTIYPSLTVQVDQNQHSILRGDQKLARAQFEVEPVWAQAHDQIGWSVFLQEIWGKPE